MNNPRVGDTVRMPVEALQIDVYILEVRNNYGRQDVLISPVNGTGESWVQASRLMEKAG